MFEYVRRVNHVREKQPLGRAPALDRDRSRLSTIERNPSGV